MTNTEVATFTSPALALHVLRAVASDSARRFEDVMCSADMSDALYELRDAGLVESERGYRYEITAVGRKLLHGVDVAAAEALVLAVSRLHEAQEEVFVRHNACSRCGLDVEGWSDESEVWRDRGGSRECSGYQPNKTGEFVRFPAGTLHVSTFE